MTYDSLDLLRQFTRLVQTLKHQGFSTMSKRSRDFWSKQPERGGMRVLHLLKKRERLTNSQLVEELDIRPSSVSVMVKRLEESGYVQRHESTDDKRVSLISLTDKGADLLKNSHDFKSEFASSLFDGLSVEEQEQLGGLLAKLTGSLEEKFGKWNEGDERPEFLNNVPEQFFGRHGFGPWDGHRRGGHRDFGPHDRDFRGRFDRGPEKPWRDRTNKR